MEKMKKKKKALFFSLAALLMALSLYFLFFHLNNYRLFSSQENEKILVYEEMKHLTSSIEFTVNKLLRLYGWKFEKRNQSLAIIQFLPNSFYVLRMNQLANFINLNTSANLSFDGIEFSIKPINLTYTNPNFPNILIDNLNVTQALSLQANITFFFTSCSWSNLAFGTYPVRLDINGIGNNCFNSTFIDLNGSSRFNIYLFGFPIAYIDFTSNRVWEFFLAPVTTLNEFNLSQENLDKLKIIYRGVLVSYEKPYEKLNLSFNPLVYLE